MIRIKEKKIFFNVERIWFKKTKSDSNCVVSRFIRQDEYNNFSKIKSVDSYTTVITNLLQSQDEILKKMRKKIRYEVNRASKEDINIKYYTYKELAENDVLINTFEEAYIKFCKTINDKNVLKAYSRKKIKQYIDNSCIVISTAEKDGAIVYHVYIYDNDMCCLIYSVSDFRDNDVDNYLAGRINKYLHYSDILYFRELGLKEYDWGNLSTNEEEKYNGIDNFKVSFGGDVVTGYNILVSNGLIGSIIVFLYAIRKMIGKK